AGQWQFARDRRGGYRAWRRVSQPQRQGKPKAGSFEHGDPLCRTAVAVIYLLCGAGGEVARQKNSPSGPVYEKSWMVTLWWMGSYSRPKKLTKLRPIFSVKIPARVYYRGHDRHHL